MRRTREGTAGTLPEVPVGFQGPKAPGSAADDDVGLAQGFLHVPHAQAVGGQQQGIAGLDLDGLAAVRGEGAAAVGEVAELLLEDLPAELAGAAFPYAGFHAVGALDGMHAGMGHRLTDGHRHRAGFGQGQGVGVLQQGGFHARASNQGGGGCAAGPRQRMRLSMKAARRAARARRQGALWGLASTRSSWTKLRMMAL